MKLLITTYIEQFPKQEQESVPISLENLTSALNHVSIPKHGQVVELHKDQSVCSQLDTALDSLDIDTMLNPNMPNTGSMEVVATLKRDLRLRLESLLAVQQN